MKNKLLSKMAAIAILLSAFFMTAGTLKAQSCGFTIKNYLGCPVQIDWDMFNGGCTTSCRSSTTLGLSPITIPAFSGGTPGSYQIPCAYFFACSNSVCNIVVTITDVGGNPTSIVVDSNTPSSGPVNVGGTCPTVNVTWSTAGVDIN